MGSFPVFGAIPESLETYEKNLEKKLKRDQTALHKLCVKGFACEADTRMMVERWLEKHPRHLPEDVKISGKHRRASDKRGRLRKDEQLDLVEFLDCTLGLDETVVSREQEFLGRFILAGNDTAIDPEVMLQYYKEKVTIERGFRFIKDKNSRI